MAAPVALAFRIAANMTTFKANMAELKLQLETTASSMKAMSKSFDGSKAMADAAALTKTIHDLGGISTLTGAEQKRALAILSDGLAKATLAGRQLPPEIKATADQLLKLRDATKQVDAASSSLGAGLGKLNGLLGVFGLAVSAGAIVGFGKHVFDTAGQIGDLAVKLDISTDAVQGFKFAAEQNGSTLDAVNAALSKMNVNLAGGDKATVQALKEAGLQFSAIRGMKPEDAFLAITDAIAKIPDPMTRADVAMQLFGKSGGELLPAIMGDFRKTADAADKMSQDTIASLKAAQDAWGRLSDKVVVVSGTIIAQSMNMVEGALGSWRKFSIFADNAIKMGIGPALALADAYEAATKAAAKHGDTLLTLPKKHRLTADEIANARKELERLESEHNKAIAVMAKAAEEGAEAWRKFRLTSIDAVNQMSDAIHKKALPAIKDMQHLMLTRPELFKMSEMTEGLAGIGDKIGQQVPVWKMWEGITVKATKSAAHGLAELSRGLADLAQVSGAGFSGIASGLASIVAGLNVAKQSIHSFSDGFKNLMGGFTLKGLAGITTGILGIASAALSVGKAIKNMLGLGTEGRDAVKAFAQSFLQVGDLAKGISGFDRLHEQLNKLGAEGERLWINLTQGVAKNNPAEAAKAIDAIRAALANMPTTMADQASAAGFKTQAALKTIAAEATKLWEYMRDSGQYSADAVQKAWEAAQAALVAAGDEQAVITQKYTDAIAKLQTEYESLAQSVAAEAPEEIMGIVETQTRARMAQIELEKAALKAQMDKAAEEAKAAQKDVQTAAQTVDEELRALFAKGYDVPIRFLYPGGMPIWDPTGSSPSSAFGGAQAAGGEYLTTRPTWFLSSEHSRPERVSFSGEGRTSGRGAGPQQISIPVYLDGMKIGQGFAELRQRLGLGVS